MYTAKDALPRKKRTKRKEYIDRQDHFTQYGTKGSYIARTIKTKWNNLMDWMPGKDFSLQGIEDIQKAVKQGERLRANAGKNIRIQHMLFTWGLSILLIFGLYVGLSEKTTSAKFFSHLTFRSRDMGGNRLPRWRGRPKTRKLKNGITFERSILEGWNLDSS